jgi:hypothetical protein
MTNKYMKKMFNILSYQGDETPNATEIPSTVSQNDCHQENKQEQILARMKCGEGTLLHCW